MLKISDIKNKSAVENVQNALDRAKASQKHNALICLIEKRALERAKRVDLGEISGKLAGIPFVVKDNILVLGGPTTAGSKILENFLSPIQSTAVEKLENEGAICIGKANLDAFGHGGSTENSFFGPTKNSKDDNLVAGGSSGGSAVAVALGIVPFALGTDTGGSIRQPASFNGVVGVKPTYGAVSRFGVISMASSTDTVGVLASTIEDAETVMSIMAGKDDRDATTVDSFFEIQAVKPNQKIGIIKEFMSEDVDEEVRQNILDYAEKLRQNGHEVVEVSIPLVKYSIAIYYIIVPAEISSNLARFDGIRFGYRAESPKSLAELYGKTRDEGFMTENIRRIMIGSFVLSSGYFDAYFKQAQKARTLLIQECEKLFAEFDVLLGPVSPVPAFKLGERSTDPISMYLADVMTVMASLVGLPALSVPAGTNKDGLPIGAQLIGARKSDASLLALAKTIEEEA